MRTHLLLDEKADGLEPEARIWASLAVCCVLRLIVTEAGTASFADVRA
jgi:hypothetical protein